MMIDKEKELLTITLEECAEVIQAISKVFRFGMDCRYPDGAPTNKEHLEEEIGDLLCMVKILEDKGVINADNVNAATLNKREKLAKWSTLDL